MSTTDTVTNPVADAAIPAPTTLDDTTIEQITTAYRAAIESEAKSKGTARNYMLAVKALLELAAKEGWTLDQSFPPEAPKLMYGKAAIVPAGKQPKGPRKNLWSSALRAFEKWAVQQGWSLPEFQYPPAYTAPKKKGPKMLTISGYVWQDGQLSQASKLKVKKTDLKERITTPSGLTIHVIGDVSNREALKAAIADVEVANEGANPQPDLSAITAASAPQTTASGPTPSPTPSNTNTIKRKPIMAGRPGTRQMVLGLVPTDGTLRVTYTSDGSDGMAPGTPVSVGDYPASAAQDYVDAVDWLKTAVHPFVSKRFGGGVIKYKIEGLDWQKRPVNSIDVPIFNGLGQAGNASGGDSKAVQILETRLKEAEQRLQQANSELSKGKSGDSSALLIDFMKAERQAQSARDEIRELRSMMKEAQSASSANQKSAFDSLGSTGGLGGLGSQPAQPDPTTKALADLTQSIMAKASEQADKNQQLMLELLRAQNQKPQENPMHEFAKTLQLVKALTQGDEETKRQAEQMRQMQFDLYQQQINALREELRDARQSGGMDAMITQIKMMREISDMFGGDSGGAVERLIEVLPDTAKSVADAMRAASVARGAQEAVGNLAGPDSPAQTQLTQGQVRHVVLPAEARNAIFALRDAESESEMTPAVLALLAALRDGEEPWPKVFNKILQDLHDADTYRDVFDLVENTFKWCGASVILETNDDLQARIADAVAKQYSDIYAALWGEEKHLSDVTVEPEADEPATDEPAVETAAGDLDSPDLEDLVVDIDDADEISEEDADALSVDDGQTASEAAREAASGAPAEPATAVVAVAVADEPAVVTDEPESASPEPESATPEPATDDDEAQAYAAHMANIGLKNGAGVAADDVIDVEAADIEGGAV